MEININCDLGEKSKHHSNENDQKLLDIVNSASIACGYHAGDEAAMRETIDISVKKGVALEHIHHLKILKILDEKN